MIKKCPICHNLLKDKSKDVFTDFMCQAHNEVIDHFYVERILNSNDQVIKIKVRLDNTLLKINYDMNNTQIWELDKEEVNIEEILTPDFSDIKKLKIKIKTLLTFS